MNDYVWHSTSSAVVDDTGNIYDIPMSKDHQKEVCLFVATTLYITKSDCAL